MADGTHRVAVVVFCEATSVDEDEAGWHATTALKRHLGARIEAVELKPVTLPDGRVLPPVVVHSAVEVATAARNGYLHTRPTGKAYPRRDESNG